MFSTGYPPDLLLDIVYSPNRNTRSSYQYSDHNSNGNTDTETDSDIDIDDTNPYIAQNYKQSHIEYNELNREGCAAGRVFSTFELNRDGGAAGHVVS
jgi:hypothetical protein